MAKRGIAPQHVDSAIASYTPASEADSRLHHPQVLIPLHQLVFSSLNLDDVMLQVARAAATLMRVPVSSLWLVDDTAQTLDLGAFSDPEMGRRFPLKRVPIGADGIGWVATHRQTLNVADVFVDGRFLSLDWWQQEHLRSFVGFPVMHEDKLLAVLALSARQSIVFTADDYAGLESFLAQAILAIRNARMFRELHSRTEELAQANTALQWEIAERKRTEMAAKTLAEVGRDLTATLDFAQASQRVVTAVLQLFQVRRAVLYRLEFASRQLVCVAAAGEGNMAEWVGKTLPIGTAMTGRVVSEGCSMWSSDLLTDDRFTFPDWAIARFHVEGVRAGVGVPLKVGGRVIGALGLGASAGRVFTGEELQLLEAFADQAALALENARLYEEASRTRDFLQSITENSVDGIVTTDVRGCFTYFSPGAEEIFGYQTADILGQPVSCYYSGGVEEAKAIMQQLRAAGRLKNYEASIRTSHGHYVQVSTSVSLVRNAAGDIVGTVGVIKDITEQKRAEAEMQRAKEAAEAANRAKSEFLANMSHEIRTPMNGVIGMTELLLDTPLSSEQREYAETVRSSAEGLLTVINDVLDFSKIEAGKLVLEKRPFSLRDVLGSTMKALALRAHEKGLELAYAVEPDVPDGLIGDAGRLRQVLVNLVGNAIKFTPHGEVALEMQVASGQSSTALSDDAHRSVMVSCVIRDTGVGIAPDKQQLIFEPFTQADSSTTRLYGGTGLGLAISRQLVELMGGSLMVDSAVGQGSTFHFTARFGWQETPTRPARYAELAHLRGLPVLVVDDNATNRRILVEVLRRWGMQPTAVEGGQAALTVMAKAAHAGTPFVLGLIDAMMPEMDGYMLAQRIKSTPALARTVLLMLTSAYQSGDNRQTREVGIAASLGKPVSQASLWHAMLMALGTPVQPAEKTARPARPEEGSPQARLRILLAEDNPVNQRLAVRLLEKHAYIVVVANNGQEVLDLLACQSFDLVLMDVQMPEVCGFEATMAIREREQRIGAGHLPIIAMTAHAMQGDRERCLQAGMDHYVSKPIHAHELMAAIAQVMAACERCVPPEAPVSLPPAHVVFDDATALARVEGDRELLRDIAMLFLADWPQSLVALRQAVQLGDTVALMRTAHTLKGAAATLGAVAVTAMAQRLEECGRCHELAPAATMLTALEDEITYLLPYLTALQQHVAR